MLRFFAHTQTLPSGSSYLANGKFGVIFTARYPRNRSPKLRALATAREGLP